MKKKYFFILTCEIQEDVRARMWKKTESGEFIPEHHNVPEKNLLAIYTFLLGRFKERFLPGAKVVTIFYHLTEVLE